MERNTFQAQAPLAFVRALRAVLNEGELPAKVYELYCSLKDSRAPQS